MSDTPPHPGRTRRARGQGLSAERIAAEALALIDAAGIEAFSFRILAARLGCQAMSIYNYYPSKAHLFEALVGICAAEAMEFADEGSWADRLRAAAAAYRRMALNHPGFFAYFATFRLNNAAGMTFLNRILTILEATGLPSEARARHFRILGDYLVGACIAETMGDARGPSAAEPVPMDVALRRFPAIMAVGPYIWTDRHKLTFTAGVEILIRGIEAEILRTRPQGRSGS